ncbi:MAG: DUF6273 domain-containing protein [Ruminococcus sp.]|nr:DUF6273 domain-containing protein [Ruminococcus sp.]
MAVFKCKMCGGMLEVTEGAKICECEYCGSKQTIPSVNEENLRSLFNRANVLRMRGEYDKAADIYEKIIQADETEAEAYWGLVLCKYGVEYVEDPATLKRVPTCHRTSFDAVITSEDYSKAIEYADIAQKSIYESEAKAIDEIQKGILNVVSSEEPYDVFICYKEADENGKRTHDSVIANDIYHQLTQEGFKVFYAAITLEDKLGSEYEPYIFAALNSSKVMLAIGTKPEYFNAVWVKNEWSRFMKIMRTDRSRTLIPCYRDMDAYELPEEFAHLQAQDMSKIGFINDIIRGIKKIVVIPEMAGGNVSNGSTVRRLDKATAANVEALLKRADISLNDGEWKKADECCEKALDLDPENGQAYLAKLMAQLKLHNAEEFQTRVGTIEGYEYFKKAQRFGDNELKAKLEEYDNQGVYNEAIEKMQSAKDAQTYREIKDVLERLGNFSGASEKAEECETLALKCLKKRKRRKRRIISILCSVVVLAIVSKLAIDKVIIPYCENREIYNTAMNYYESGDLGAAYNIFVELGDFSDSKEMINKVCSKLSNGDIIEFGDYSWIVLEKSDDTMLIITEDIIEDRAYNEQKEDITWENCTLREYLNGSFYDSFSEEEQSMIVETNLTNPDNSKCGTDGGNDTTDKIFLLSLEEAEEYMTEDERIASDRWWLRSPGGIQDHTAVVSISGVIGTNGFYVNYEYGVRPALRLKLS